MTFSTEILGSLKQNSKKFSTQKLQAFCCRMLFLNLKCTLNKVKRRKYLSVGLMRGCTVSDTKISPGVVAWSPFLAPAESTPLDGVLDER